MSDQIHNFRKLRRLKFVEAKTSIGFGSNFITKIIKFLFYFSMVLLIMLALASVTGISSFNSGLFAIFLSLTLALFIVLNFNTGFLDSLKKNQTFKKGQTDINYIFSFELIVILSELFKRDASLNTVIKKIVNTKRSRFVIDKIGFRPEHLEKVINNFPSNVNFDDLWEVIVAEAINTAIEQTSSNVSSADVLYGILKQSNEYKQISLELELEDSDVKNIIFWANRHFNEIENQPNLIERLKRGSAGIGQDWSSGYTLAINNYGMDLTQKGISGSYSIEGRWDVVQKIESALTNDAKRSCLLVGPTGVGKTTIGFGLAKKLFWGLSEPEINYHRVVKLDAQSIASSSTNKSEIQKILTNILNDAVRAGNVILFIDEIQSLFASNDTLGSINASEVIQPYLENANIRIVGTITERDYETYIRPKGAIAGNFEVIKVEPTNEEQTMKILCDMAIYVQNKKNKYLTYASLKEIYRISSTLNEGKELPAKAIDLLLEISSSREITEKHITKEAVLSHIQKVKGIPVSNLDQQSKSVLLGLEEKIKSRLIGQGEAVTAVVSALKRVLTQERKNQKPIGSFLFLGPTGVGKTELAKSLAWAYFGSEKTMIRMDMNQYKDIDAINRFVGKKITEKNELEGGDFVKQIRQQPHSVILLDEIEKANKEVLDLFLQILDEGYLTDGLGQRVSLANNIIIGTSNAGALEIKRLINQGVTNPKDQILNKIQEDGTFKPEFLNRFDGIIVFSPLRPEEILNVASLMINKTIKSYLRKGYKIRLQNELIIKLAEDGYQPDLGARPMQRMIQDKLEAYIADRILDNTFQKGGEYEIRLGDIYGAIQ